MSNKKKNNSKSKKKRSNSKVDILKIISNLVATYDTSKKFILKTDIKEEEIYILAIIACSVDLGIKQSKKKNIELFQKVMIRFEKEKEYLNDISNHPFIKYAFCYLSTLFVLKRINVKVLNNGMNFIEEEIEKLEYIADNVEKLSSFFNDLDESETMNLISFYHGK